MLQPYEDRRARSAAAHGAARIAPDDEVRDPVAEALAWSLDTIRSDLIGVGITPTPEAVAVYREALAGALAEHEARRRLASP